jgi:hypothetical protein
MEKEKEYLKLLETLIKVVEANKGLPAGTDDRVLDAEGLAFKFFGHACSAFYLHRSTTIPETMSSFFDVGSINVLGRAALETFLVFYYVFVNPSSDQERDFRYLSWLLAGLLERQEFPAHSLSGKALLSSEKKLIAPLQEKLKNHPQLLSLPHKQQKKLIKKGEWRIHSWKDIGLSAGLDETHAKAFYYYLCGFAHAGNLSVLQIRQARTANSQKSLCAATISLIMIAIANMIKSYCKIFPISQSVLTEDTEAATLVEIWVTVGSTSTEDIDVDWESKNLRI